MKYAFWDSFITEIHGTSPGFRMVELGGSRLRGFSRIDSDTYLTVKIFDYKTYYSLECSYYSKRFEGRTEIGKLVIPHAGLSSVRQCAEKIYAQYTALSDSRR